jgi:hypothetical protein
MAGQDQKRCTLPEGGCGLSLGKRLCFCSLGNMVSCRVDLLGEVDGGIPLATVWGGFSAKRMEVPGVLKKLTRLKGARPPVHEPSST